MTKNELAILFLGGLVFFAMSWLISINQRIDIIEHGLDAAIAHKMGCE